MNPLIPMLIQGAINAVMEAPAEPEAPPIQALQRAMPQETKVGEMRPPYGGYVQIDSQILRLSPGAQIRGPENRIVMPMTIHVAAKVRYLLDPSGDVFRVWILTPAEAALAN